MGSLDPGEPLSSSGVSSEAVLDVVVDHIYIPLEDVEAVEFEACGDRISFAAGPASRPIVYQVNGSARPATREVVWTGSSIAMPDIERAVGVRREDRRRVLGGLRGVLRAAGAAVATNVTDFVRAFPAPFPSEPPLTLVVRCPASHADFAGEYSRGGGGEYNRAPVWVHAGQPGGGAPHGGADKSWAIYRSPGLAWMLERDDDAVRARNVGYIQSPISAGVALLPHEVPNWRRWNGAQWVVDDAISVTAGPG